MDTMEVILYSFVDVPSVIEMNFEIACVTLSDLSHLGEDSRRTRIWSPGDMNYLIAVGSFDFRDLWIFFSETIFQFRSCCIETINYLGLIQRVRVRARERQ